MRPTAACFAAARVLGTLLEERIPSIGFLHAFHDSFGLPPTGGRGKRTPDPPDLQKKINVLLRSGEETRTALRRWRELEERYFEQTNVLLAIEDASLTLRELVLMEDEDAINFDDLDAPALTAAQIRSDCEDKLDKIAAQVAKCAPEGLFHRAAGGTSSEAPPPSGHGEKQLRHLAQVIHGELRFRQDPYEWVYDGLKPLLLDGLLQNHKGIHISLASLYCAVARRLGCAIYPRTAPESGSDYEAIQAGLSLATAPTPDPWLLEVHTGQKQVAGVLLDPTSGEVLPQAEALRRFPGLQQATTATPLPFWKGLVRVATTAHQRRGDGDAVAHCLLQLLALDPTAPEWASALRPAQIRR